MQRGAHINRVFGDPAKQLAARHDLVDFDRVVEGGCRDRKGRWVYAFAARALKKADKPGLDALNRAFLARAKRGADSNQQTLLTTAREMGVPSTLTARIE